MGAAEPETRHNEPNSNADSVPPPADAPLDLAALFRRLGPTGWLAVVAGTVPVLGLLTLVATMSDLAPWLQSHAGPGVALFIALFALLSGVAVLPTHAAAILGGFAFGFPIGLPASLAGFLGGSLIGYAIARGVSGDRVVQLLNEKPQWRAVYEALLKGGFARTLLIVALVRLPPNSPFAMTNLVLAATRVPLPAYLLGTLLGMLPRVSIIVWIASHASTLDFSQKGNRWVFIGGIVVTLAVLAVLAHIGKRAIAHVTSHEGATEPRAR